MSMFKYRDRTTIMSEILRAVKTKREAKKTQIMELARLNYTQTKKYLNYLVNYGYLAVTEKETYIITEKGVRFLHMTEIQRIHVIR
ncbi:MAG: winged helix-turn-helix domain-containing protein [Candidatus Bathyarchaeia archaeon]|nr:winged helix DNA-binding protein [Candidatus Bathyarchaeota archaeon]